MKFLIKLLSSGLFVGYTPKIPGTASTIVYAFIYLLVFPDNNYLSLILITLFLPFSVIVSHMAEKVYGKKDDQRIVIDEVIGIWIGLVFLPKTILFTILGIIFFRIFDIKKPLFINRVQSIKGGVGIVIDDVLAGLLTNAVLQIIYILFKGIL